MKILQKSYYLLLFKCLFIKYLAHNNFFTRPRNYTTAFYLKSIFVNYLSLSIYTRRIAYMFLDMTRTIEIIGNKKNLFVRFYG